MPTYPLYGGNFADHAALILGGRCHWQWLGDSQTTSGRAFTTPAELLRRIQVRWNYMFAPIGGNQNICPTFGTMNGTVTSATVTSYGGNSTDVNSGASTPNLGTHSTKFVFSGNNAEAHWTSTSGGFLIHRTQQDNTTGRRFPWPLLTANNTKPWYHTDRFKVAPIIQGVTAGSNVAGIAVAPNRTGVSNTPLLASLTFTDVSITDSATIQRLGWSTDHVDAGNYQTTASLSTLNDHTLVCEIRPGTGVDETGKTIIFLGALFARCQSGGALITDNTDDNSSPGFAWIGRSGSSLEDWDQNYWTQTQWQEFFTATVLNPNKVSVMTIMLGHNLNGTHYSGSTMTATHHTRWVSFITKLRAAYAAAFPVGTYPSAKLNLMLVMPWRATTASNTGTQTLGLAQGQQAEIELLCSSFANMSWFSFFNAFERIEPFQSLHSESESSGDLLGRTFFDALHTTTNFRYHQFIPATTNSNRTIASRSR